MFKENRLAYMATQSPESLAAQGGKIDAPIINSKGLTPAEVRAKNLAAKAATQTAPATVQPANNTATGVKIEPVAPPQQAATTPQPPAQPIKPPEKTVSIDYDQYEKERQGLVVLSEQARAAGLSEENIKSALDLASKDVTHIEDIKKYFESKIAKTNSAKPGDQVLNQAFEGNNPTGSNSLPGSNIEGVTTDSFNAFDDFAKTLKEEQGTAAKATQDALVKSAENTYNAQIKILQDAEELQKSIAARRDELVGESAAIQRQELQNSYDANQRLIDLQKKKTAEAYQDMIDQQYLLNKQRQVREETALGLIYGGFGSVAANKNIEDTIMSGEREIIKIRRDASNADTELQDKAIELNKAYELDSRKIEQWKAEEMNKTYEDLQKYVQEINNNELLASVEKEKNIASAVTNYQSKIAEINATVAQARYDLSLSIIDKTEEMKQKEFNNQLAINQENRTQKTWEFEQATNEFNQLATVYAMTDFNNLEPELKAKFSELEDRMGMPSGYISDALSSIKAQAQDEAAQKTEFFTNQKTGDVTAITYNPSIQQYEMQSFGAVAAPKGNYTIYKNGDGQSILLNKETGSTRPINNADAQTPTEPIKEAVIGDTTVKAQSTFLSDLQKADAALFAATGSHLIINQSYRSIEEQRAIRAKFGYTDDSQPSGYNNLPLAAPPGQSFHNQGLAVDVSNWQEAKPYLELFGIVNGLEGDMGHFSRGEMNAGYYATTNKVNNTEPTKKTTSTAPKPSTSSNPYSKK